jgi:hypothetical protein
MKRIFFSQLIAVLVGLNAAAATDPDQKKANAYFDSQVHPLLERHCFKCHGAEEKLKGGLRLTSREGLMRGGDSGGAMDESDTGKSLLLDMLSYRDDHHQMPPKGKLEESEIAVFREWLRRGAPYNSAREIHGSKITATQANVVSAETKRYWAFKPVVRPPVPQVAQNDWSRNPIDAYIFSRLVAKGLRPNPAASKAQLIRRAFYDLTGLPPTQAEVVSFQNNPSPAAFEEVIDDLLARPQYGEKWGRHWLDLVRYAESNGYERDGWKPQVWRYRDYVIKAFNDDKAYDRFLQEQLAGDELRPFSAEAMVATGYYRLGLWDDEPVDPHQAYYDGLDDILSITGQAMLGLTIGCARCHDHKIDPIPQVDYYSMLSFFGNVRHYGQRSSQTVYDHSVRALLPPKRAELLREELNKDSATLRKLEGPLKRIDKIAMAQLSGGERDDYKYEDNRISILSKYVGQWISQTKFDEYAACFAERKEVQGRLNHGVELALVVTEAGANAPETHVHVRGNAHALGAPVVPAFLSVTSPPEPGVKPGPDGLTTGRRTALARWIASENNPLTARVFANRIWQHHFGRGIVRTSDNFGRLGEQPTHPELLDWLAAEFVEGGWKIKAMHKKIMLSKTYQMSSGGRGDALAKDPANDLFWRFNLRRLTAEEVRDSAINLTGRLNLKVGGPSVYTDIPDEVLATASRPHAVWGSSSEEDRNRRSVYVAIRRSLNEPVLKTFDMADTDGHCSVRFASVLPTQSLTMLNSRFFNDVAIGFAARVRREAGQAVERQVSRAFGIAFNRRPSPDELTRGVRFIEDLESSPIPGEKAAGSAPLERFCLLLLNLNEFLFVD